ncbi:unnamed protein product [Sphagnum troendelagicum]|uniref:Uncharacterized protein n=1 Tax=Sphagnum troendelagicum TaxID=128251 RepID=A0ABP0UQZ4_9BRYO
MVKSGWKNVPHIIKHRLVIVFVDGGAQDRVILAKLDQVAMLCFNDVNLLNRPMQRHVTAIRFEYVMDKEPVTKLGELMRKNRRHFKIRKAIPAIALCLDPGQASDNAYRIFCNLADDVLAFDR